jgi:hypothetical protein
MSPSRPPRRLIILSSRTRRILYWVLGVLVLGGVIIGVGALAKPKTNNIALPPVTGESAADKLYREAITAQQSGDATRAIDLLQQAAARGSSQAMQKLEGMNVTPTSEISSPSPKPQVPSSPKPTDLSAGFSDPVADVSKLLPFAVAGYSAGTVESSTLGALLPLEPTNKGPAGVSRVVLTVIDEGSAKGAQSYVDGLSKAYAKDYRKVNVGVVSARFATDGQSLASVAFARGRFAFEAVVTVPNGNPVSVEQIAVDAAKSFPAAK